LNTKEFIESGKLENYVLGISSSEDKQEVECMARIFPEVKNELENIRGSFEQYINAKAVTPPASVKTKVFEIIERNEKNNPDRSDSGIISMEEHRNSTTGAIKFLIAAIIVLAMISAYYVNQLSQENKKLITQIDTLSSQINENNSKFTDLNNEFKKTKEQVALWNNPEAIRVTMKGTALSPQSVATILWNKNSKDVFISVNSLPSPPDGKQYQLWGIVSGKPVDLGVFSMNDSSNDLHKMKPVEGATTFAVTLETAGGSPAPTLDQMYVAGNI
jgi:anti-sigma-K factor RskA